MTDPEISHLRDLLLQVPEVAEVYIVPQVIYIIAGEKVFPERVEEEIYHVQLLSAISLRK